MTAYAPPADLPAWPEPATPQALAELAARGDGGMWPFDPAHGGKVRHRVIPDLWPLAVPLETLRPLPGNPRRGDVKAMQRSLTTYGQRKPVVVNVESDQPTVEAGNHTLAAAKALKWTHLAIARVRDDPTTETGYALADNRLGELGTFDLDLLADATSRLQAADPALLLAAGYDHAAAQHILLGAGRITAPDPTEEWVGMPDYAAEDLQAAWTVKIAFRSKEDAAAFFAQLDRPVARRMWWPDNDRQGQFSTEAWEALDPEGGGDAAEA
jgi:ParB/Sulfiredoxin domain